jgi:Asp-tRNA(Asn)/Glu-tRNA(Gln) amidotransferase A subunit family amidase
VEGFFALSPELDHPGPIAATVAEAAVMLDAMAPEAEATKGVGTGVRGRTLGYARDWFAQDPAPRPAGAGGDGCGGLEPVDGRRAIVEVAMPDYDLLEAVGAVKIHVEGLRLHEASLRDRGDLWGRMATQTVQAWVVPLRRRPRAGRGAGSRSLGRAGSRARGLRRRS